MAFMAVQEDAVGDETNEDDANGDNNGGKVKSSLVSLSSICSCPSLWSCELEEEEEEEEEDNDNDDTAKS